jgi:hypothetical protein
MLVDLLTFSDEEGNSHFVYIKDDNGVIGSQTNKSKFK